MKLPKALFSPLFTALFALATGLPDLRAELMISEFMASNRGGLADEDGSFPDWIEIHNPDAVAVDLTGWFLTGTATNKTKWRFPTVSIAPGGYLIVFASNKNRTDPASPLHTNFSLNAAGEYLALVRPDGTTVAFEYAPTFPPQDENVSYGVFARAANGRVDLAYFPNPTPGAANTTSPGSGLPGQVGFSRTPGLFSGQFTLTLSGAGTGQVIRYNQFSVQPAVGVNVDPQPSSPVYANGLVVNQSIEIRAAVFSADGSVRGPVAVAHFTRLANEVRNFTTKLPLLVFDTSGTGPLSKDGIDYPAWMYLHEPRANTPPVFDAAPDLVTPLTVSVRGHTSADFPKQGYTLRLLDADGRRTPQALLKLPAQDAWTFVAPWKFDYSYFKNAFVYALSNEIGRWAPRTKFVEAFFNMDGDDLESADYAGIHVLTDRIEVGPSRVAIPALTAADTTGTALTGGYILKIDNPEGGDFSWRTKRGLPVDEGVAIILVAPDKDEITRTQRTYIMDYIQQMEDALVADRDSGFARRTYLDYIDRASWVDHHILNTFVINPDALEHSAYFTKPRNQPLQAGPVWDFDKALSTEVEDYGNRPDAWSARFGIDLWNSGWWGILARDPEFMQDWVERWQSLRATSLSTASLTARADALAAEIGPDAAKRDATRWPDNTSSAGSYAAEIEVQKRWLTQRAQWIDEQFVAPPTVTTQGSNLVFRAPAGAQLAYTTDGSDPRSLGGAIAPNAVVSSQAVSVAATANVHVRSYRADRRNVFPGSPWSSAVGGARSSPLFPVARIINLSTRASVGAGEDALFTGVVVADSNAKRYLARAVGPGLAAFGAEGFVPDPQLSIFSSAGKELFRNNGWQTGPDAASIPEYSRSVGAFALPAGSLDSALASQLAADSYTFQVSTPSGKPGVGLVEMYELAGNGRTANLSSRARVRTGDGVLIGGFVIQGPAYKRMLIRAVGPSLAPLGVSTPLLDPVLTIYQGSNPVATNDRWEASTNATALRAASSGVGAFQLLAGSEDAAMLVTLPPDAYTAKVEGKNGGEGVALLEIYEVP